MKAITFRLLCGVLATTLAAAGCSRAQARVVPELPALDVPAPPPRIVEAVLPEEPPTLPAEPVEQIRLTPAKPAKPVPAQRVDTPKPEPPKVEVPAPPEPARPTEESRGKPAGVLQTTPAGREAQLESTIRDMLTRANTNLSRVQYGTLNADARTQYDQARSFM